MRAPAALRFSIKKTAYLCGLCALMIAAAAYLVFHAYYDPWSFHGRSAWFGLGNGWVGVMFGGSVIVFFGWHLSIAVWRFITKRPALASLKDGLWIHPSIGKPRFLPWSELKTAKVELQSQRRSRFFGNRNYYRIVIERRPSSGDNGTLVPIRCPIDVVEGGLLRACRYAKALNGHAAPGS